METLFSSRRDKLGNDDACHHPTSLCRRAFKCANGSISDAAYGAHTKPGSYGDCRAGNIDHAGGVQGGPRQLGSSILARDGLYWPLAVPSQEVDARVVDAVLQVTGRARRRVEIVLVAAPGAISTLGWK